MHGAIAEVAAGGLSDVDVLIVPNGPTQTGSTELAVRLPWSRFGFPELPVTNPTVVACNDASWWPA